MRAIRMGLRWSESVYIGVRPPSGARDPVRTHTR